MNSRIPVNEAVHAMLREYAKGLGVNMNDALLYLLTDKLEVGDDPLLKGHAERDELKAKMSLMKRLEDSKDQ